MVQGRIENKGASLYYQVVGEGIPLVFTHGASWNHKQWQRQEDFFKEKYRVVTWDVRGHGASSLPPGKVDSRDFSEDLIALLDHLQIESAILCGLSLGGHISLQTAAWYPKRVQGLSLIGTPCTNAFDLYEKLFVPINRLSTRLTPMRVLGRLQAKMLSKFNPSNALYIEEAVTMIPHSNWTRIWSSVSRMESRDLLSTIQCKTLLLIGDHDSLTRRQQSYMLARIPTCELQTIPKAHHGTNLDNPQAVNQAILEFVQELSS